MIDATHLKAHRTAASLLKRGCSPTYRTYQRRPELQAPCRLRWHRPSAAHAAQRKADRGYDADWFRAALTERDIAPCIPSKVNRKVPIPHDTVLYRQRHKIENMFGKLKDWRRIRTRYDRCAHTFMSATRAHQVAHRIDYVTEIHFPRSATSSRSRHQRSDPIPLLVGQITRIALRLALNSRNPASARFSPHPDPESRFTPVGNPSCPNFQTASNPLPSAKLVLRAEEYDTIFSR
jgi:transposase